MNSAIVWEGPSQLPGQTGRVAAIVTGLKTGSANIKTGPEPQLWLIPTDQGSLLGEDGAVREGRETAVCGGCKHRPSQGGACYVVIKHGPQAVWYTHQAGRYPAPGLATIREALRGQSIRFGAYGEPPCIPREVYSELLPVLSEWQGYTHAWRSLDVATWGFLMASVDTPAEALEAHLRGWRTFRVRDASEPLFPWEAVCPASEEGGSRLTCIQCGQCDGNRVRPYRRSRAIIAHGYRSPRFYSVTHQLRLFG